MQYSPQNMGMDAEAVCVPAATLTSAEACKRAAAAFVAGRLGEAEHYCRPLLDKVPDHFIALHMLAAIKARRGEHAESIAAFDLALQVRPNDVDALNNRANALKVLNRFEEALDGFDRALEVQPDHTVALINRGIVLRHLKRFDESLASLDHVLALHPGNAEAHNNCGKTLSDMERHSEATACFDRALALQPNYVEALNNRASAQLALKQFDAALESFDQAIKLRPDFALAHVNRGHMLSDLRRFEEALLSYDRALELQPDSAELWSIRSIVLLGLRRFDEALQSSDRAIALRPDLAAAHNNRGNALQDLKRFEEAIACYEHAIVLRPDYVEPYNNLGVTFKELRRYDEALAYFERALAIRPDYAKAELNVAMVRLMLGDFERGFRQYEQRWSTDALKVLRRKFKQPQWFGDVDINGKTILLHFEQGFGDAVQFCRYAPLVEARGAHVLLDVPEPLKELMKTLPGASKVLASGETAEFDLHCPLLSLPLAFGTKPETIPAEVPYLGAMPETLHSWQARLGPKHLRVGLAWTGNPNFNNDHNRSMSLRTLLPLLDVKAKFVSLQREIRTEDATLLKEQRNVVHFGDELRDFSDTAAVVAGLDLVISIDTAVAHLAGALGKPVWILLPFIPDWRWMLDRDDSPWYPTARLFRQDGARTWTAVVERVATALREFAAQREQTLNDADASYRASAARALVERGRESRRLNRPEAALAHLDEALKLRPAYVAAHDSRGIVLRELKRLEESLESHRQAVSLRPNFPEGFNNLGCTLLELKRMDEALAAFDHAIALRPQYELAHKNRATALGLLRRFDEALAAYDRLIAHHPDDCELLTDRAHCYLALGDFERGWTEYEWRWQSRRMQWEKRDFAQPLWRGSGSIAGKTILLHAEQGLGDTIQFSRYVPMVAAQGARVILQVPASLKRLMSGLAGPTVMLVTRSEPAPACELHCPLMSLPLAFGTRLATIPPVAPRLHAPRETVEQWMKRLGPRRRPRVGIVWTGLASYANDRNRSMPLEAMLTLLKLPVDVVSLQKEVRSMDQAVLAARGSGIAHYGDALTDFQETAALASLMDVVISVDTAVAHLAATLGRPTWIMLPYMADWRWLVGRTDSPWYPSARLFRQSVHGDWSDVMRRVYAELSKLVEFEVGQARLTTVRADHH